jgi:hypothetical protein
MLTARPFIASALQEIARTFHPIALSGGTWHENTPAILPARPYHARIRRYNDRRRRAND